MAIVLAIVFVVVLFFISDIIVAIKFARLFQLNRHRIRFTLVSSEIDVHSRQFAIFLRNTVQTILFISSLAILRLVLLRLIRRLLGLFLLLFLLAIVLLELFQQLRQLIIILKNQFLIDQPIDNDLDRT